MGPDAAPAYTQLPRDLTQTRTARCETIDFFGLLRGQRVAVALALSPHSPELVDRLPMVGRRGAYVVDERNNRVARQTADTVSEPFASDEDRRADVKAERVMFEGRAVSVPQ